MLISVIVPVYNVEIYLKECVESIINQNNMQFEILLIDDGSTDNSGILCDQLAGEYPCIKVIHQKNGGLSSARNKGIQEAKGDYLLFVDSDDILLEEDALSEISKSIDRINPDLLMILPREYNEDFSTVVVEHQPFMWKENMVYFSKEIMNQLYQENGIYITMAQTKVIAREYCIKNNLFFTEGIYHEDDEWIAKVLLTNPRIAFLSKALYGYRHRRASIISTLDQKKIKKKARDKMDIAIKVLKNNKTVQYPYMMDYFVSYYLGGYAQFFKLNEINDVSEIPFLYFRYSKNRKIKLLFLINKVLGYTISRKLLECILSNLR